VASLSETARQLLRFKLAEALASRNAALVSALEAALGRTIVEVRAITSRNTTATEGTVMIRDTDARRADVAGESLKHHMRTESGCTHHRRPGAY